MRQDLWRIVLAAGAGRRLAGMTGGIPKQFWSPDGGPTLLEETLDRTDRLGTCSKTAIVVDRAHAPFITALPDVQRRRVLYQPSNRGTATGVLFGLTEVMRIDPDADILLLPSDQGVVQRELFLAGIRAAAREMDAGSADVVLFGVGATCANRDYGWITPGRATPGALLRPVAAFCEKPSVEAASELHRCGSVWNTMLLLARARALLNLFRRCLPALTDVFLEAQMLDAGARMAFLGAQYPHFPLADFSRDVLSRAQDLSLYSWPAAIGWSDLGTPDRVRGWQHARNAEHEPSLMDPDAPQLMSCVRL